MIVESHRLFSPFESELIRPRSPPPRTLPSLPLPLLRLHRRTINSQTTRRSPRRRFVASFPSSSALFRFFFPPSYLTSSLPLRSFRSIDPELEPESPKTSLLTQRRPELRKQTRRRPRRPRRERNLDRSPRRRLQLPERSRRLPRPLLLR